MGKHNKHMKQLKAEKAKVKLKAKKTKTLPKGQNVTDASFKVKKIVIREQLKEHDETEILSKRKLNVKELLTRLQHHNLSVRQEAIKELKDMLTQYTAEILSSQLQSLLQGISSLSLDKERNIRRDAMRVLNLLLSSISNEQLLPFCDVLISYLKCAMTHIDPNIKEDSLIFLDVLIQNCSVLLAKNSHKVLPNFLDMISKMHTDTKPGRQLTTTLNSKNTSIKWRNKVLEKLVGMLGSIINYKKHCKEKISNARTKFLYMNQNGRYIPIYKENSSVTCQIDLAQNESLVYDEREETLDIQELEKYVNTLIPLMVDSWIEVCPKENLLTNSELVISAEAALLLKNILDIIQLIIECIELLDIENDGNSGVWFKNTFQNIFEKHFLIRFPYSKAKTVEKTRKRQESFTEAELTERCMEQNLTLCQIYTWLTSINTRNKAVEKLNKTYCVNVRAYLNDKIENWHMNDAGVLNHLIKVLKTLFLRASKEWYANNITLESTLTAAINACLSIPQKELQSRLFMILGDVILDHTLTSLQSEKVFKNFVSMLPNLLLKPSIHENTIQVINKVVLRYKGWIQKQLINNHNNIIENAKNIEVIGSIDVKQSRLTICNLFYFIDGQIYY